MSRIFSLIFISFFYFSSSVLAHADNIYSVLDVPVNVEDENPTMSRNLAISTAHRNAFVTLLSRLELDLELVNQISDEELFDMVVSQHIADEKISGNNYSAIFNVTFGKDFVERILSEKDLQQQDDDFSDSKGNYLVIPVQIKNQKTLLWEEQNQWRKAVEMVLLNKDYNRLILPYNDIENVTTINRANVFNVNYSDIDSMISRYKADGAFLLFFSNTNSKNKIQVEISYIAKMQSKRMKLSFVNAKNLQYQSLISIVADKSIQYVSNLKVHHFSKIGDMSLAFNVKINSLGDWLRLKSQIENSGLINQLNINSISRDNVEVKVNYIGPNENIVKVFASKGIILTPSSDNSYIIES